MLSPASAFENRSAPIFKVPLSSSCEDESLEIDDTKWEV